MGNTITLNCTNCGAPLKCEKDATMADCDWCSSTSKIETKADIYAKIADINSQAAASTHISFVLEKADWREFAQDPTALSLEEIDALVEKIKRIAGDKPETYEMCFNYIHACTTKKLQAIAELVDALVTEYVQFGNYNTVENKFDVLSQSAQALEKAAPKITQQLKENITLAAEYGLDVSRLEELEKKSILVEELLSQKAPESLKGIPAISAELNRIRANKIAEYAQKGVNAEAVYTQAVQLYEAGDLDKAVDAFNVVIDFEDAKDYVRKINSHEIVWACTVAEQRMAVEEDLAILAIEKELAEMASQKPEPLVKTDKADKAARKAEKQAQKAKLQAQRQASRETAKTARDLRAKRATRKDNGYFIAGTKCALYSKSKEDTMLYGSSEGLLIGDPVVSLKSNYLTSIDKSWGNRLCYKSSDNTLTFCKTSIEKTKYKWWQGAIKIDNPTENTPADIDFYGNITIFEYSKCQADNKLLIEVSTERNISSTVRVAFFKKFAPGIVAEPVPAKKGILDVWEVDVATGIATFRLQNVNMTYAYDDDLFYTKYVVDTQIKKVFSNKKAYMQQLCCITKEGQVIENIYAGRVKIWDKLKDGTIVIKKHKECFSGCANADLIIKRGMHADAEEIVVEKNVYGYYGNYQNKLLYSVGNSVVRGLYSYDITTGEIREQFKYIKEVAFVLENWIYLKIGGERNAKGEPENFAVIRKSLDGDDWQLVISLAKSLAIIPQGHDSETFARIDDGRKHIKNGRIYYIKAKPKRKKSSESDEKDVIKDGKINSEKASDGLEMYDELCSVRLNGTDDREMLKGFDMIIGITKNSVYYLAQDDLAGNYSAIYSMNHCGSMRHKLVVDVINAATSVGDVIYYTQGIRRSHAELTSHITTPRIAKKVKRARKKYDKKGVDMYSKTVALNQFNCATQEVTELAVKEWMPTRRELRKFKKSFNSNYKIYMKEQLESDY